MKRLLLILLIALGSANASALETSGYAPVNGLKMYYEIYGQGRPVVLIHGAYMTLEGPMREMAAKLSETRQVILPELQGHGRTGDINRPITYENLADDVAGLIRHLKLDSVDVIGYSMGGGTALQFAIRHPELVSRLVCISASYSYDGLQEVFKPFVPQITPAIFDGTPVRATYDQVAPRPEDFPKLVEKLKALDLAPFNWEADYVKITAPTLLVFGDADVVNIPHIMDMFTKLGGGVFGDMQPMPSVRLAILPGTSHVGVMFKLNEITPMITDFLNNKPAPANPFAPEGGN